MLRKILLLLALVSLLVAPITAVRSQWAQLGRAEPSSTITVRFALTQANLDVLEQTLLDVSNPTSPSYGKWWTAEQVTELVAPSKSVSSGVAQFLALAGRVEDRRDMVKLTADVATVEQLLQTTLFTFRHKSRTTRDIIRAVGTHSIPSEIADYVDFVSGLYEFPSLSDKAQQPISDFFAGTDGYIVPYVINNLYNIPDTFPTNKNSSICLVEFQDDQSYDKDDLTKFTTENALPAINVDHIVGPFDDSDADAESTLDVQYGGAIAKNTSVWFWTVADWMYEFATDFLATSNPPLVVSMSWGWPEPEQCTVGNCTGDETSIQYVQRTNVEFQKIGLIGVTLLAASGDQGAPGDSDPDCNKKGKDALSTIFPGASPWVLSVGATMLTNSTMDEFEEAAEPPICSTYTCATSTTEIVCSYPAALITTGGGFSDYSPVPSYQSTVVSAYLSSGTPLPPSTDFNSSNRGFPDVSALGHNYLIYIDDDFNQVDGTSCSAPVFAAIIALLNSERLNNGKPPLGFVVPLIYQAYTSNPSIFTDITQGDNKCTENCCSKYGYEATKGWDPVTGLGTPNFAKLLSYVKSLP